MGVTIHIEGQARSEKDFEGIIYLSEDFAKKNNGKYKHFAKEDGILSRAFGDEINTIFKSKGIIINFHEKCDSLILEFDENLTLYTFCKTQFAPIEIHVLIIEFLKEIQSHFLTFNVIDEGEYWQTENIDLLKQNIENCFKGINFIEQSSKQDQRWRYN